MEKIVNKNLIDEMTHIEIMNMAILRLEALYVKMRDNPAYDREMVTIEVSDIIDIFDEDACN